MDSSTLSALLDSNTQAFHSALDVLAAQFSSRISDMEKSISDLTRSLEFSQAEVADLQNEVRTLRKSDSEKQATIESPKACSDELTSRVNYQEENGRTYE